MTALTEIMDALADQLQAALGGTADPLIEELSVNARFVPSPTPPAIDIYPGDPFQEALGFGRGNSTLFLTVRARVLTADHEAGQDLLLGMMDPLANTSVAQAITEDRTLGGKVTKASIVDPSPSSFGVFLDAGGQGNLLGCVWRVQVVP